jgi:hypothetical protein
MKSHRIGVRVSAELHALLTAAGDVSSATRALAILGAQAAGYDVSSLQDEAAGLLASPLDAQLRAALLGLLSQCSTSVLQLWDRRSTVVEHVLNAPVSPAPPDAHTVDPLLSIGIDV